ncbi:MAG: TIGR02449 family protein [Gammaproteobacteria bacterium]|nr:MAG: TIGR02449 family protein [Gammaproteobacteria bacterium]
MEKIPRIELSALENRIDALIRRCEHLEEENRMLRLERERLMAERTQLLEKHIQAQTHIEAIILRLKAME